VFVLVEMIGLAGDLSTISGAWSARSSNHMCDCAIPGQPQKLRRQLCRLPGFAGSRPSKTFLARVIRCS